MNIKNILLDMPKNLTEIEKARYIYLKLGLLLSFSTKYRNTTSEEFVKMYIEEVDLENFNIHNTFGKNWAIIYSYLLDCVKIPNDIISNKEIECVRFMVDNKYWIANATYGNYTDLSRIKYGDNTSNFGVAQQQARNKKNSLIDTYDSSMRLLEKIDKKITFYSERKEKLKRIKTILSQNNNIVFNPKKKIEMIFDTVGELSNGYYEAKNFIQSMEHKYLTMEELKYIHKVELKRTLKNKDVDIIECTCIENDNNNNYDYYLLAPNLPIQKVSAKEIINLSLLGYGIDTYKIPNIIYPRNFNRGVVDNKFPFYKLLIPKSIIKYDELETKNISGYTYEKM